MSEVRNGAYVAGDKVTYYRMHGDACAAEVLSVSPRGRLRLRVHQGGVVPYYTATNVLPTSVHRRENAKSEVRSGQYDAAPADAHLEAALAKLRANTGEFKPRLLRDEAAALLAKLEAADRLVEAAESQAADLGHTDTYLLDCAAAYRNPQPAGVHSPDFFGRPHNVEYDKLGWICSVCNGWNHSRDRLCTHTHGHPAEAKP